MLTTFYFFFFAGDGGTVVTSNITGILRYNASGSSSSVASGSATQRPISGIMRGGILFEDDFHYSAGPLSGNGEWIDDPTGSGSLAVNGDGDIVPGGIGTRISAALAPGVLDSPIPKPYSVSVVFTFTHPPAAQTDMIWIGMGYTIDDGPLTNNGHYIGAKLQARSGGPTLWTVSYDSGGDDGSASGGDSGSDTPEGPPPVNIDYDMSGSHTLTLHVINDRAAALLDGVQIVRKNFPEPDPPQIPLIRLQMRSSVPNIHVQRVYYEYGP